MAKRDWFCEDILSFELKVEKKGLYVRVNAAALDVTPHMHWHILGPGVP